MRTPELDELAEVKPAGGKGTPVRGRHGGYRLDDSVRWHDDAEGGVVCAGIDSSLSIQLTFGRGVEDPASIRDALRAMEYQPVLVRVRGLRFRGVLLHCSWNQTADDRGRPSLATASLSVAGESV